MTRRLFCFILSVFLAGQTAKAISLRVAEYNIDQNGFGYGIPTEQGIAPQLALIQSTIPNVDILGLIEAERGCSASNLVDGPNFFATALGLYSYYAVEFVKNTDIATVCTTGNAILSRYPLENFETIRFTAQCCDYPNRTGGRIMSIGHINRSYLGTSRGLYVIVVHLEAGGSSLETIVAGIYAREAQLEEVKSYVQSQIDPERDDVIIFGDFNAPSANLPDFLSPIRILKEIGFKDTFEEIPIMERATVPGTSAGDCLFALEIPSQLDYIFIRSKNVNITQPQIVINRDSRMLSDHFPVSAMLTLN